MGYYTVDLEDKTDNKNLLTEYLLYKQSVKFEGSFLNNEGELVEQVSVKKKECKCKKEKRDIVKFHCGELAKKLITIIRDILIEFNSTGIVEISIVNIKKETITEIVDKVIDQAKLEIDEMAEIIVEESHYPFGRYYLLRQLIEILLFIELD